MNIAFDSEPIISAQMTGIGYSQAGMITALMKAHASDHYQFTYFAMRNADQKAALLAQYLNGNCEQRVCRAFSGGVYKLIRGLIPVPYSFFFGSAEITHFFNFLIPPGVKGKKVVTVHDMAFKVFPDTVKFRTRAVLSLQLRQSLRRADRIVTPSLFTKNELMRLYDVPDKKIAVIPNGVELDRFTHAQDKLSVDTVLLKYGISGYKYFLYVGTIEPRKNIDRLLDAYDKAFKSLNEGEQLPVLVLAGKKGWYCDEIYEKATALEKAGIIKMIGYVSDEDLPRLYAGAIALLFPSLYEGFGIPILEAMACGTPVLTSNAASMPEVCGDAALLCDPFSIDDMANGILKLYLEPELREKMSGIGIERAELYSWPAVAEQLYALYTEVANEQ